MVGAWPLGDTVSDDLESQLGKILGRILKRDRLSRTEVGEVLREMRDVLAASQVSEEVADEFLEEVARRIRGEEEHRPPVSVHAFVRVVQRVLLDLGLVKLDPEVEEAQEAIDQEAAQEQAEKLFAGTFTMDDFLGLFEQMKKLGPMKKVMEMAGPGFDQLTDGISPEEVEVQMARTKAMILSMTPRERFHPEILDDSRRRRIARGSGTSLGDVDQLMKEFKQARKMFKQVGQQGGLGSALARRGLRKRRSRRLRMLYEDGQVIGRTRRLPCSRCGAPSVLTGTPTSAGEELGPANRLSPEERDRWNRWI
ncbi:MAG: signal recognition particle receptor subunit alpha [Planctomycetota bacterium]|jgi:signal recognition particle GTPase